MLKIHPATAQADQDQIDRMVRLACAHEGSVHNNPLPSTCQVLVAEQNNQICGMIALHQLSPDLVQVSHLWVDPEFRRQGIGRALLDAIHSKEIVLLLKRNNVVAFNFYKNLGFVEGEFVNLRKVREANVVKTI
jgi:ribosomal protein S18 acetylase RimI-like enzyme